MTTSLTKRRCFDQDEAMSSQNRLLGQLATSYGFENTITGISIFRRDYPREEK